MRIDYVYKICTKKEWNFFKEKKTWHGSNKDIEDGFIHLSDREQVNQTLKKYFSKLKMSRKCIKKYFNFSILVKKRNK